VDRFTARVEAEVEVSRYEKISVRESIGGCEYKRHVKAATEKESDVEGDIQGSQDVRL
jgi:hypothetical protein